MAASFGGLLYVLRIRIRGFDVYGFLQGERGAMVFVGLRGGFLCGGFGVLCKFNGSWEIPSKRVGVYSNRLMKS